MWKYEEETQAYTKTQNYTVSHKKGKERGGGVVQREILPSELGRAP